MCLCFRPNFSLSLSLSLSLLCVCDCFSPKKKKKSRGIESTFLQAPQTIKRKQYSILGVIICVHMLCSCHVNAKVSNHINLHEHTRLLIESQPLNPNMTCLLNKLTRYNSYNPFNKHVLRSAWPNITHLINRSCSQVYMHG